MPKKKETVERTRMVATSPRSIVAEKALAVEEAPRKKNFRLHQSKIDRAMEILGTRTETETIEQALDMIVLRNKLVRGVRSMKDANLSSPFVEPL
jgi:hypothetical protein